MQLAPTVELGGVLTVVRAKLPPSRTVLDVRPFHPGGDSTFMLPGEGNVLEGGHLVAQVFLPPLVELIQKRSLLERGIPHLGCTGICPQHLCPGVKSLLCKEWLYWVSIGQ